MNPTWNPNHGYILEDDKSPHAVAFLIWDTDNSPGFTAIFYKDGRHSHEQYFYNDVFEPEKQVA